MFGKNFWALLVVCASAGLVMTVSAAHATSTTVLISAVQIAGTSATDEWVELENISDTPVDITHWRLTKRTASGTESNLVTDFPDVSLAAGAHVLIASADYVGQTSADMQYSTSGTLAANNTLILYSDPGTTIADLVGWGTAKDFEGAALANPDANTALVRQRDTQGQVIDTDNNTSDFTLINDYIPKNIQTADTVSDPNMDASTDQPTTDDASTLNNPISPNTGGTDTTGTFIEQSVLINEFVANPQTGHKEWVELVNTTDNPIDLTNWQLKDGSGKTSTLSGSIGITDARWNIFDTLTIALNNDGDLIELDAPDGTVIDRVTYGKWPTIDGVSAGPNTKDDTSIALDSETSASDFALTTTLTPGAANTITPPIEPRTGSSSAPVTGSVMTTVPRDIITISEVLPNPKGDDRGGEFIELHNAGGVTVNLADWELVVGDEVYHFPHDTPTLIMSGTYLTLSRTHTGLALKNIGHNTINLKNPSNHIVDSMYYDGPTPEEQSWAKDFLDRWHWSTSISPGAMNSIRNPNRAPVIIAAVPNHAVLGRAITLDGSDSYDLDHDELVWQWTVIKNTTTIATSNDPYWNLTLSTSGAHTIVAAASDGHDTSTKSFTTHVDADGTHVTSSQTPLTLPKAPTIITASASIKSPTTKPPTRTIATSTAKKTTSSTSTTTITGPVNTIDGKFLLRHGNYLWISTAQGEQPVWLHSQLLVLNKKDLVEGHGITVTGPMITREGMNVIVVQSPHDLVWHDTPNTAQVISGGISTTSPTTAKPATTIHTTTKFPLATILTVLFGLFAAIALVALHPHTHEWLNRQRERIKLCFVHLKLLIRNVSERFD